MMQMSKRYELELRDLPFSRGDDQVIYVESSFNPQMNRFIESHLEELKRMFAQECLDFCYIPEVSGRFRETERENWHRLPFDSSMIPSDGSHLRTSDVFCGDVCKGDVEPTFICNQRRARIGDSVVFEAYHIDLSCIDREYMMMDQMRHIAKAYSRRERIDYRRVTSDGETARMLSEMERMARALMAKGVRTKVFEEMVASLDRPSPLVVDGRGHVVLPEYGDMQIRLNPMEKTLYHFFLAHPDGILADELVGHRRELMALYRKASVFDEWELAENAIDALLSEDKKTFYTNVSRIKSRFTSRLGDRIARNYIIRKDERGVYSIPLPRSMVSHGGGWWNRDGNKDE